MESIPNAEKLTRRERMAYFGKELLDHVLKRSEIYTGFPSELEYRRRGIHQLENFANGIIEQPKKDDPEEKPF